MSQKVRTASNDQFIVNFISIGAGTDNKAEQQFLDYLKKFQKENKLTLDYKLEHWGKEGETKYMFDLKKLPMKQKKELTGAITEMFKKNKLVQVGNSQS